MQENTIKFGPSGNSESFFAQGFTATVDAAAWCKVLNLDVYEYSFGRGVRLNREAALKIGEAFKAQAIELTAHAPYYINFANQDAEMLEKSAVYILSSLKCLAHFGGKRLVVHTSSQGKLTREEAVNATKENLRRFVDANADAIEPYIICLETMGKQGQIGTVEEIADFCAISPCFYPCIDFGHVNARTRGGLKTAKDYEDIIKYLFDKLPEVKVKNMHVHFSKIMYGASGEIMHLTFEDKKYGPEFEPLCEALHKYKLTPCIICESAGTQAEDAAAMKKLYYSKGALRSIRSI